MAADHQGHIRKGVDPEPSPRNEGWLETPRELPDLLLWRPTLFAQLLSGIVAGAILGAADGLAAHYILDVFESQQAAWLLGAALGAGGGILIVLFRRIVFGPEISVEVGTILGLFYGIVPASCIVLLNIFVHRIVFHGWIYVGMVMAGSMIGMVIGGVLDRITEMIIARLKQKLSQSPQTQATGDSLGEPPVV